MLLSQRKIFKYADKTAPVVARSVVTQGSSFFDPFNYTNLYSTVLTARRPNGRGIIFTDYHGQSRAPYLTNTDFFINDALKPALTLVDRVERLEEAFPHIQTKIDDHGIKLFIGMLGGDENNAGDESKARDEIKRLAAEAKVIPFL